MGLTLSLTEVMSMASDFATILGFVFLVLNKVIQNYLLAPGSLLITLLWIISAAFLSISQLVMYLVVARAAERHEVGAVMCSSPGDGQDMMHLVHKRHTALRQTPLA
jgi:hypothetical protein